LDRTVTKSPRICVIRIWFVMSLVDVRWKSTTKSTPTFIMIITNLDANKIGVRNLSTPFKTDPVISHVELANE
jgi:hypothetical protein